MRRFIPRMATIFLLLTVLAASVVAAAPTAQERFGTLESLNVYFPKDTMLYAATRTDRDIVATFDRLAQAVQSQLPQGTIPKEFPTSLTAVLDFVAQQATNGTFANNVRPWLGDTVAVGIYPAIRSAAGRIVIKITDPKAALDAALKALRGWTSREVDGYTLLTNSTDRNRVAIYPDVMIMYSWSEDVGPQPVATVNPNVSSNPYYTTALSRLPDSNYDILAFVDTPLMVAYNERQSYHNGGDWIFPAAVLRAIGSTGIGVHVGSDQTLTIDVAQTPGNTVGLDALGVHFTGQGQSLKPEILARVPRDAVMVLQAADVGSMLEFVGDSAQSAAKKFQVLLTSIITGIAYSNGPSAAGLFSGGFASIGNTEWAKVFFSNLSGYDYDSEIRPLLSGSSALFLNLNPAYSPTSPTFVNREPFDGGLLLEAKDAATAQQFISKLQRELAISIYSSGDQNSVRIQEVTLVGGAQSVSLTVYGETGQPFDQFIAASQDNLLVMGTARAVNQVLGGEGLGFDTTSSGTLPDVGATLYVNLPGAQSPAWTTFIKSDPGDPVLQLLPYFVQNAALSVSGSAQNDMLMRLTVTLPCGDNCG